jgi:hypothetical protein
MDDLRWRPTSKLAYATRKARGSAGQKLLLRKVRFWPRKAAVHAQQHLVVDMDELEMESVGD